MVCTVLGMILLVFVFGLSSLFLLFVLVNFLIESREKRFHERVLRVVPLDLANRPYPRWQSW